MQFLTELGSLSDYLLGIELGLCCVLAALMLVHHRSAGAWSLLCFLVLSALLYSHWGSAGRPVLGITLASPGAWITRFVQLSAPLWLRRFVEPSLWLFFLSLVGLSSAVGSRRARSYFSLAATFLLLLILLESVWLTEFWFAQIELTNILRQAVVVLQGVLVHGCLLMTALGLFFYRRGAPQEVAARRVPFVRLVATAITLFLIPALLYSEKPMRAGAHYYSWFPENWKAGYALRKVVPKIEPLLGEYLSDDPAVFSQHLKWARQYGLDFFVFDWWPERPDIGRRILENLNRQQDLGSFQYALMYETLDLNKPGDVFREGLPADTVYLDEIRKERLKLHWEYLANNYMKREGYLRVDGKAVLFVYATRHLVGPVSDAIQAARRHVKESTGVELYLVADEAFFHVLGLNRAGEVKLLPKFEPNWQRLIAFDAITAYNPYDASRKEFAGVRGVENWLAAVEKLFARYKAIAATVGIPFVPGVLPGYNDRGVRLNADHYVIPRTFGPLGQEADQSLFQHALERHVRPFLSGESSLFVVTSWNEWNEGTQIEPTQYSPATNKDKSDWGINYTQGEWHEGYQSKHLRELKAFVTAK